MLTIVDEHKQHQVSGRIEEIVRIVLLHGDEIARGNLQLWFDCSSTTIVPSIKRTLEKPARRAS